MALDIKVERSLIILYSIMLFIGTFLGLYVVFAWIAPQLCLKKCGEEILSNFINANKEFFGALLNIHGHIQHFGTLILLSSIGIGVVGFAEKERKILALGLIVAMILWPITMYMFSIAGQEWVTAIIGIADLLWILATAWIALATIGFFKEIPKVELKFNELKNPVSLMNFVAFGATALLIAMGGWLAVTYELAGHEIPKVLASLHMHLIVFVWAGYMSVLIAAEVGDEKFAKILALINIVGSAIYAIGMLVFSSTSSAYIVPVLGGIIAGIGILMPIIPLIKSSEVFPKVIKWTLVLMFLWLGLSMIFGSYYFYLLAQSALAENSSATADEILLYWSKGGPIKVLKCIHQRDAEWSLLSIIVLYAAYKLGLDDERLEVLAMFTILMVFSALIGLSMFYYAIQGKFQLPIAAVVLRLGEYMLLGLSIYLFISAAFKVKKE